MLGLIVVAGAVVAAASLAEIAGAACSASCWPSPLRSLLGWHETALGAVSLSLPAFAEFTWGPADVTEVLPSALGLAFVASVNILITSRVVEHFQGRHRPLRAADADAELGAYGIANLFAGVFGAPLSVGIPARSLANLRCGGTTRLSNLLHAVFLLMLAALRLGADRADSPGGLGRRDGLRRAWGCWSGAPGGDSPACAGSMPSRSLPPPPPCSRPTPLPPWPSAARSMSFGIFMLKLAPIENVHCDRASQRGFLMSSRPMIASNVTFFKTPAEFRKWLAKNHATAAELWVGFYKKDSGKPSITWPESVDEALCVGWIDGIRKNLDETSYTIRFTRRKTGSIWSAVNIKRAGELIELKRMKPAGLEAFEKRTRRSLASLLVRAAGVAARRRV